MKKIILFAVISFCITVGYAQQSTRPKIVKALIDKTRGITLLMEDVSVDLEGYDGDSLIIEDVTHKFKKVIPPEADGLKLLTLNKAPSVVKELSYTFVSYSGTYQISAPPACEHLHIKVPKNPYGLLVNAKHMKLGAYLSIKNWSSPLEFDGAVRTVYVSNVGGTINIKNQGEKVVLANILWVKNATGYPYLIFAEGDIDISFPEDLKVDIHFFPAMYPRVLSEVYTDLDLPGKWGFFKLNGGSGEVKLFLENANANRGNTYLRKQKK